MFAQERTTVERKTRKDWTSDEQRSEAYEMYHRLVMEGKSKKSAKEAVACHFKSVGYWAVESLVLRRHCEPLKKRGKKNAVIPNNIERVPSPLPSSQLNPVPVITPSSSQITCSPPLPPQPIVQEPSTSAEISTDIVTALQCYRHAMFPEEDQTDLYYEFPSLSPTPPKSPSPAPVPTTSPSTSPTPSYVTLLPARRKRAFALRLNPTPEEIRAILVLKGCMTGSEAARKTGASKHLVSFP